MTRDEFQQLALDQLDMVHRVAHSLTRNRAEAEDLVQETYLRAIRAWSTFQLRDHGIRPWLIRILQNLHITRAGRESRQPRAVEDEQLVSASGAAESAIDRWEANEELARAMERLPPELRSALTLWAVEDFSYQEMADAFEIPIGTVMSRLHRAKRQLREIVQGFAANPPA